MVCNIEGAKNLSPLLFPSPSFLSCQRYESSGRKRSPKKYQPRRGCPSATLHRRNRVARLRHAGFCVWGRISTDSRKAAPCGGLPKFYVSLSFRPLGLNRSVETRPSTQKKYQPRRGCPSATLHRRDRVARLRHAGFCRYIFSTELRKPTECGGLPRPTVVSSRR